MKRPDLRLVPSSGPSEIPAPGANRRFNRVMATEGAQLLLPFDNDITARHIVIVSMDHIHGTRFCRLILDLRPRVAIDVRHLIRFDLPGTSRVEVFNHLNLTHTLYVKESLPWHKLHARNFMLDDMVISHRLNHEVLEREDSPVLILASKRDEARYLNAYLNRMLSLKARYPWIVEQEI